MKIKIVEVDSQAKSRNIISKDIISKDIIGLFPHDSMTDKVTFYQKMGI